jgi:hypothetical protein
MPIRHLTRLAAAGAIGLAGFGVAALVPVASASAATTSINLNAKCSGSSVGNLQVQREDTGALSVDFGVDMARHKAGVQWNVTETNSGVTFVNKSVKTIRDGSFSITSVLAPAASNAVVGTAVNPISGETCGISGTV